MCAHLLSLYSILDSLQVLLRQLETPPVSTVVYAVAQTLERHLKTCTSNLSPLPVTSWPTALLYLFTWLDSTILIVLVEYTTPMPCMLCTWAFWWTGDCVRVCVCVCV